LLHLAKYLRQLYHIVWSNGNNRLNEFGSSESIKDKIIIAFRLPSEVRQKIGIEKIIDFEGWAERYSVVIDPKYCDLFTELKLINTSPSSLFAPDESFSLTGQKIYQ
jgi:hypothetical protein